MKLFIPHAFGKRCLWELQAARAGTCSQLSIIGNALVAFTLCRQLACLRPLALAKVTFASILYTHHIVVVLCNPHTHTLINSCRAAGRKENSLRLSTNRMCCNGMACFSASSCEYTLYTHLICLSDSIASAGSSP